MIVLLLAAALAPCQPAPEIRQALERLPDSSNLQIPFEQRLAPLRALLEQHPRDLFLHRRSVPPPPIMIAEFYTKWRARLDQVPGLVQLGLREAELQQKYRPDAGMFPEELRARIEAEDPVEPSRQRASAIMADYYLATKQPDAARDAIQHGMAELDAGKGDPRRLDYLRNEWLTRQARLAELEGDPQTALSFYQRYLQPVSPQFFNADRYAEIKKLYLANGGTEADWPVWAKAGAKQAPAPAPPTLVFTRPLPDFEAKTWRAEPGGSPT